MHDVHPGAGPSPASDGLPRLDQRAAYSLPEAHRHLTIHAPSVHSICLVQVLLPRPGVPCPSQSAIAPPTSHHKNMVWASSNPAKAWRQHLALPNSLAGTVLVSSLSHGDCHPEPKRGLPRKYVHGGASPFSTAGRISSPHKRASVSKIMAMCRKWSGRQLML